MGHADVKMILRYAHLAPENKLQAVKPPDSWQGKIVHLKYRHTVVTIKNTMSS
jgi:hypothetical protein